MLFEEGWSEIDHDIVYPYYKDDEMLKDFSTLLNRLSGMADEMSSYFRRMRSVREEQELLAHHSAEDENKNTLSFPGSRKNHRRESVFFIYCRGTRCLF